jgi:hypothetical protein
VAHAGEVIENPVTGERVVFRQTARDTGGELLQFEPIFTREMGLREIRESTRTNERKEPA